MIIKFVYRLVKDQRGEDLIEFAFMGVFVGVVAATILPGASIFFMGAYRWVLQHVHDTWFQSTCVLLALAITMAILGRRDAKEDRY
ncbi:MAG: hypothetical protein NTV02_00685 [Candidatus Zambryskibacteria bacterium]|nr:hypothetical protein [Candidatus Zambryskibacteria bacterium]